MLIFSLDEFKNFRNIDKKIAAGSLQLRLMKTTWNTKIA
jgi:hypothetical protein